MYVTPHYAGLAAEKLREVSREKPDATAATI
jgi:hypothetical protein